MKIEMSLSTLKTYMAAEIGLKEDQLQWMRDGGPCLPLSPTLVIDIPDEIAPEVIARWSEKQKAPT